MAHMTSTGSSMRNHTGYPGLSVESISPVAFRNACGMFGTGVTVITTRSDGADHGMTVNAFMSISLPLAGQPDRSIGEPFYDFDDLPGVKYACKVLATDVEQEVAAGDHVVFIGRVSRMHVDPDRAPLIFHKGKFGKLLSVERNEADRALLWHGGHW
jgi:flavin reductase (DIM6/NTAB) family NADH-FMN oxidoreductase RutF